MDREKYKLFNVSLSPYTVNLPDVLWLEIMLKASPLELLQLQRVSKRFCDILADNPRSWTEARHNMNPPVPPPPHVNAAGVWTESAYAQFLFGGGNCIVKSCKKWTARFPTSYALRARVCSTKCDAILHRHYETEARKINNGYLTSCAIPGKRGLRQMGQTQRLHFRNWLVHDERDLTQHPMYRVSIVSAADQEWFSARAITEKRPVRPPVAVLRTVEELKAQYKLRAEALPQIMQNAEALQVWSKQYADARKAIDLVNVSFLKEVISPREQIPYRKLLKTPAVSRAFEAFGQSLSRLDIRIWCGMRANAVREYRENITIRHSQ
ncbi:hypothetical protein B0H17DRAFT_1207404 [Mycena rosella]|uniref:F-box domain-containing protein n=1 Tax=Mycena rosella TaxID=1033263 RepID=A0AAD7D4B6_MYCRO|nr:hypothetical protein B0H17DRAFT_1207404 [Mycena rosella]